MFKAGLLLILIASIGGAQCRMPRMPSFSNRGPIGRSIAEMLKRNTVKAMGGAATLGGAVAFAVEMIVEALTDPDETETKEALQGFFPMRFTLSETEFALNVEQFGKKHFFEKVEEALKKEKEEICMSAPNGEQIKIRNNNVGIGMLLLYTISGQQRNTQLFECI
ncbi:unnamed protein product, partial [Mesorhabditis spiculigera]